MKQIVTQRPLPINYAQNSINPYYMTAPPQMMSKPPVMIPQQSYGIGTPIMIQPHMSQHPVYAVQPQMASYGPQYQPIYLPVGGQIQPNYPSYFYQPVRAPNNHPQEHLNPNFDYEAANFLCDTKIVQNTVYCVICGSNYKGSQREQHLKKHMRKSNQPSTSYQESLHKVAGQMKASNKKHYITKPIVQPEEHTVVHQPLVYDLVQEIHYQDNSLAEMKDEAIGYQPSFSLQDPNMSIDRGNNINVPNTIQTQNNPFASGRYSGNSGLREPSNTLNQPVPFLPNVPIPKNPSVIGQLNNSGIASSRMQSVNYPTDQVIIQNVPQINTIPKI